MALYLIAFNDEWVPDLTVEELRERGAAARALIEEMTGAGVFVFSDGGLDASTAVCSVDASSGSPPFTPRPLPPTQGAPGGFGGADRRGQRRRQQRLARLHRRAVHRDQGAPRRFRGRRRARRCRGTVLGRPDRGRGRLAAGGAPLPASRAQGRPAV